MDEELRSLVEQFVQTSKGWHKKTLAYSAVLAAVIRENPGISAVRIERYLSEAEVSAQKIVDQEFLELEEALARDIDVEPAFRSYLARTT